MRQAATVAARKVQGAVMRPVWPLIDLAASVLDALTPAPAESYSRYRARVEKDHAELAFAADPDNPRIETPRVRAVRVRPRTWEWHMSLSVPLHPGMGDFAGIAGLQQVLCAGGTAPTQSLAVCEGHFRAGVILAPVVNAIEAFNEQNGGS